MHNGSLHSGAAPVDDADLAEPRHLRLKQVFFNDDANLTRLE
jgi:hypothetical protein